ncbi:MAG: phosphate ABC transporter ATP-binding protein PstB [Bacillota bacterium]
MQNVGSDKIIARNFELYYGKFRALKGLTASFRKNAITAIIGPSGCGKSTFLRSINRMNDRIEGVSVKGEIALDGVDVYGSGVDLTWLRSRIGMVFQRPVVFPLSVFDNVAVASRIQETRNRAEVEDTVERSLREVALWDEVKDCLRAPALELSLGNQQKLSIARAIATRPDVILLDEPCSALDPQATLKIEELMWFLRDAYTIIIVTHNMQQASRASDFTMFMLDGEIVEFRPTSDLFTNPKDVRTENYVTGRIG